MHTSETSYLVKQVIVFNFPELQCLSAALTFATFISRFNSYSATLPLRRVCQLPQQTTSSQPR